jgi:phosphotransferase system HPr (HPr) family protein
MELVRKLRINNELGLHARAAAKIVALAGQYEAKLFLKKDEHEVDGSSILSVLTLACPRGTELLARAVGRDSEALLQALSTLFEERFGEGK